MDLLFALFIAACLTAMAVCILLFIREEYEKRRRARMIEEMEAEAERAAWLADHSIHTGDR